MSRKMRLFKKQEAELKLDLGCGKNKREGFIGVDAIKFDGVDIQFDLGNVFVPWPWKNGSVSEVHASHFVEHLEAEQRIHFANELHRVLQSGGTATIVTPHWASCRAYGDLTHKWPPVSEFWFYYLSKEWRAINAPHNDFYTCDFEVTWGFVEHEGLKGRSDEYKAHAITFYKEAVSDLISNWKKK